MLSATDEVLQGAIIHFLEVLLESFTGLLEPLMMEDADCSKMQAWTDDEGQKLVGTSLMTLFKATVNEPHVVWSTDEADILTRQVRSCNSICAFFDTAPKLLQVVGGVVSEADSHRMVRALREDFTAEFVNVDFRNAAASVLRSPLLSRTGQLIPALERLAMAESARVAKQIMEKLAVLISLKDPVKHFPTLDLTQAKKFEDFQAVHSAFEFHLFDCIARYTCFSYVCVALCKVGSDVWAQARHCAHSAGDQVFAKDIHRLHCFVTLISTAFKVKVLDAAVHKGGVKYSERACTVQNCKVLRSFMNAYRDFEESTVQEENAQQVADTFVMNCKALQGKSQWSDIRTSVAAAKADFIDRFKRLWTADLSTFSEVISKHALDLDVHKENFLSKKEVMDQLIQNVDGFNKLPKPCASNGEIHDALKKTLPRDARIVDGDVLKQARKNADMGVENVVYTLIAFYFVDELPKASNIIIIQRLTTELRDHAASHNVPLPEHIKKALADLDAEKVKPADLLPKKGGDKGNESNDPVDDSQNPSSGTGLGKRWVALSPGKRSQFEAELAQDACDELPEAELAQEPKKAKRKRFSLLASDT